MTHTLDSYGGTTQLTGKSTGWFHLEELDGRRWFITPKGNAFFPVSLAHIYTGNSQRTVQKLYDGDKDAWIEKWFLCLALQSALVKGLGQSLVVVLGQTYHVSIERRSVR